MSTVQVKEPVFDRNIRNIHYFNGRLLNADDLNQEQNANREERRRLGLALGDGVVYGLEVSPTTGKDRQRAPSITVNAGLAIDRRGQTLSLADPVDIPLKTGSETSPVANSSVTTFEECDPPDAGPYVAGAGMYLLTIGAVRGHEGRALVAGTGSIDLSCNTKFDVPGIRFGMVQLDLPPSYLSHQDLLRNRFAYDCFVGEPPVQDAVYADLFGSPTTTYGIIDDLRADLLQDCEVPLALIYLTASSGLVFVDMWPVRRRITPRPVATRFPLLTGERRAAEGEAMFMQFQDQVDDLCDTLDDPGAVKAVDYFRYLPPVGIIPLTGVGFLRGFQQSTFFETIIVRQPVTHIEGARVEVLVRIAQRYPPLDLESGVMVQTYFVRENQQAIGGSPPDSTVQPYLIFTTGHMPDMSDPHFDVNRWDYSNFA